MTDHGTRNSVLSGTFVDELARAGVRHACVCPGSRSTPLVMALAHHPDIRTWVLVDERSAAFFALGIARARSEPVALLSSSGTAAANFHPAVLEAYYGRVPLIVLTADRPPELRDFGAAQTIDQIRLYGGHVKWFVDMPVPELTDDLIRHARVAANRAVATALAAPAGPVHVNFPFREPLLPAPNLEQPARALDLNMPVERASGAPYVAVTRGTRMPEPAAIATLAHELAETSRGLIVCGPQDDSVLADAVVRLAAALGYPILADPLSQVRCGPHDRSLVIDTHDAFLRNDAICRELAPEVVLRFGAMPTSKPLMLYLQYYPARRQVLIDGADGWRDPLLAVSDVLHADPVAVCQALADAVLPLCDAPAAREWNGRWREVARLTKRAICDELATDELFEGRVFSELAELLPDGATLFAGNSMPVRDLDTFFPSSERAIRFLANRGANGIDGVVSSALGVAAVSEGPLVLVIGDLSLYHDLNGLLAARKYGLEATIVLLNNDGGGIFSFLPQAAYPDMFEELFGTPTGLDFQLASALYRASFSRPASWSAFRDDLRTALSTDGLSIVEVVTDRDRNVTQHRNIWRAVTARLWEHAPSGVA